MKTFRSLLPVLAGLVAVASARGATLTEDFSANPFASGWNIVGETNLFHWNSTNQNLQVTWDSSKSNSYFCQPLGTIVSRDDDFSFGFDLYLTDIGPANSYLFSFQLAVGLLNLDQARQPGFVRGSGFESPNVVEFDYFRADDFGDPNTAYPTVIASNTVFNYNSGEQNSTNYTLALGQWHRIEMSYAASNHTVLLVITNLSDPSSMRLEQPLNASFVSGTNDFRVGSLSISSYNDAGQYPGSEGSILAHGFVDNVAVTVPPPPVQGLSASFDQGLPQVVFVSRSNWVYTLERTLDFITFTNATAPTPGTGGPLILVDANSAGKQGFYRVRAERP